MIPQIQIGLLHTLTYTSKLLVRNKTLQQNRWFQFSHCELSIYIYDIHAYQRGRCHRSSSLLPTKCGLLRRVKSSQGSLYTFTACITSIKRGCDFVNWSHKSGLTKVVFHKRLVFHKSDLTKEVGISQGWSHKKGWSLITVVSQEIGILEEWSHKKGWPLTRVISEEVGLTKEVGLSQEWSHKRLVFHNWSHKRGWSLIRPVSQ
jgi:hypothetical protein